MHDEACEHDHAHGHDHHHHHGHDHDAAHDHVHDEDIKGVSLTAERPIDGQKITQWLNQLLAEQGPDILRAKGIIDVAGEERRLVFQAVHMILEGDLQRPWKPEERRYSRLVFIGRNLDEAKLRRDFESTIAA